MLAKERKGLTYREIAELADMKVQNVQSALGSRHPRMRYGEVVAANKVGMTTTMIERLCTAMQVGLRYRPGDGWHPTEP